MPLMLPCLPSPKAMTHPDSHRSNDCYWEVGGRLRTAPDPALRGNAVLALLDPLELLVWSRVLVLLVLADRAGMVTPLRAAIHAVLSRCTLPRLSLSYCPTHRVSPGLVAPGLAVVGHSHALRP